MATVGLISLGCPKNRLDSELMLGLLQAAGYQIVPEAEAAILIVNTCGFIQEAKEEAIQTTLEAAQYKTAGACRWLIMAGCFAQRYAPDLVAELPEVDFFMGIDDVPQVVAICQHLERAEQPIPSRVGAGRRAKARLTAASRLTANLTQRAPATYLYDDRVPRTRLGGTHSAYVKIAEGCRYKCSFCAIPLIRGELRSRPLASIVREVETLTAQGVQEVNLIAQDTTSYGIDLIGKSLLVPLLEQLVQIPGLPWIRVMYAYPTSLDRDLMRLIATEEKLCTYLDLPLQHIDNAILSAMRRGITETQTRELVAQLRREIPGLTLRTSLIVGFPGETDAAFDLLLDFVKTVRFERLGVFTYSAEEGTAAADLPNPVPAKIAEKRRQAIMAAQAEISLQQQQALVGTVQTVLVDGESAETPLLIEARTAGQAPEIDGVVYINDGDTTPGAFERVLITEALPYDLVGKIVTA